MDFAAERLADRLQPFADPGPIVIIIEGVLMYLDEPRIRELLHTLRSLFPRGEILCDVMTNEFANQFGRESGKSSASWVPCSPCHRARSKRFSPTSTTGRPCRSPLAAIAKR